EITRTIKEIYLYIYVFFYQAEDGIRAFHVTGVQTCALPILALAAQSQRDADRQIQGVEQRQERLKQELRELNAPDPDNLERLQGDLNMLQNQLQQAQEHMQHLDRKSTRLNSSHVKISYAVFCLKKKKKRT